VPHYRYSTPRRYCRLRCSLSTPGLATTHIALASGVRYRATGSHVPCKSLSQAHATSMPDTIWPVSRHLPDSSQDHPLTLVLMSSQPVSTLQQWFTCVRLHGSHLTRSCRAFSATLTTSALNRRSLRWFDASPCRATPEGLPPSFAQLRTFSHDDPLHRPSFLCSWHTWIQAKA
jgi:hypothetical protein